MSKRLKKAVFLDRDGVINKIIIRNGVISCPWKFEEFEFLADVKQILERFKKMGFLNIIFTNQPDIKRGSLKITELKKMNEMILKNLPVDEIKFCPHDDADNCHCRKPKPGMILEAIQKWIIDPKKSYAIGDNWKDIKAGKTAGCKTFLIRKAYNKNVQTDYDFVVNNFKKTVAIIKNLKN